jgi:RND family efflux transporter MFP subunit
MLPSRHFVGSVPRRPRTASAARRLALAPLLLLAACGRDAPPPPPPPEVTVAAVIERDINDWDEFSGRLQAVESVDIRPRVTGYIERVAFREGADVRKGDLLFVIDPRPYQADLSRAEAALARAKAQAELGRAQRDRAERLVGTNAISRDDYDARVNAARAAEADVASAEAAVRAARLNLEFTRITSPIDGRASRAEVTTGNLVQSTGNPPTLLTTVVSMDPIYVEFEGDEQVYLKYTELSRRGDRASSRQARNPVFMGLSSEEGYPHEGYMVFVDNRLNTQTGTIRGRAVFENKDRLFTPGLFARIKLIGSGKYHALLVSDRAIGTDQDHKFVLVLGADGKLEYREVKIGRVVDGLRVVLEGVKAGEKIVVNGLQRARPKQAVKATEVPMDQGVPASARLPVVDPPKPRR